MTETGTTPHASVAPTRYILLGAMSLACGLACACAPARATVGDEVVGRWKLQSHTTEVSGQSFDSHAALIRQRPCASAIVYELTADGRFRLDASASDCDESYKKTQEKLYAKTKWKVDGDKLTTSSTNFAVGQNYMVEVVGNRMTWVGTEGQGTLVFEK